LGLLSSPQELMVMARAAIGMSAVTRVPRIAHLRPGEVWAEVRWSEPRSGVESVSIRPRTLGLGL
jgi:hypothetical protein